MDTGKNVGLYKAGLKGRGGAFSAKSQTLGSVFGIRCNKLGWLHRLYSATAIFRPKKDALKLDYYAARAHKKMVMELNSDLKCRIISLPPNTGG